MSIHKGQSLYKVYSEQLAILRQEHFLIFCFNNQLFNNLTIMKKPILTSLIVVVTLIITSCDNNTPIDAHEGHDSATTEAEKAIETPGVAQLKDASLDAVYQEYLNLNRALVNSNEEEARIVANTLESAAKELANGKAIAMNATKISEVGTIKEQRVAFSDLSNLLIALVKEIGVASGEVYVDYCPMAFNNTGAYWLSSEKGIRNPYYGERMMTCGETKETL